MNKYKGLDLVSRVPEEPWTEDWNIVQEAVTKTILKRKKWENAKWLCEEALQIAEKRREAEDIEEREKYVHSPRARHPGMWSLVGLRKRSYKQS